jgi:hypothetical protein
MFLGHAPSLRSLLWRSKGLKIKLDHSTTRRPNSVEVLVIAPQRVRLRSPGRVQVCELEHRWIRGRPGDQDRFYNVIPEIELSLLRALQYVKIERVGACTFDYDETKHSMEQDAGFEQTRN